MIIVRAPVRMSFGGGGTDLATYYEKYEGLVVSTSIDKYFYSIFKPRKDDKIQIISSNLNVLKAFKDFDSLKFGEDLDIPVAVIKHFNYRNGFDLFLSSEIPPGSGLGGSSSLCVNLVKLMDHLKNLQLSKKEVAEKAYEIRINELKLPVGKQDEYASSFGGFNFIKFRKGDVEVVPLKIDNEIKEALEQNMVLFYTGKIRSSTNILRSMEKAKSEGIEALHEVKRLGLEIKKALESGDLNHFGELLHESWLNKKKFTEGISNDFLDKIYDMARNDGVIGGKITGAGGGGFFMFYCEKENQEKVSADLEKANLKKLEFKFENEGAKVLIDSK